MRALRLRRSAFIATLFSGLALTATGVHGMSQVDTTLQVAASTTRERPALVSDQSRWDCPDKPDGYDRRV